MAIEVDITSYTMCLTSELCIQHLIIMTPQPTVSVHNVFVSAKMMGVTRFCLFVVGVVCVYFFEGGGEGHYYLPLSLFFFLEV